MSLRLRTIVIDVNDPERMAAFWGHALGYDVLERDADGVTIGVRQPVAEDLAAGAVVPTIDLLVVPEGKAGKNRLHLDLTPAGGASQQQEVERLLGLGATSADVGQGARPDPTWVVLADPEGNEFCVLRGR